MHVVYPAYVHLPFNYNYFFPEPLYQYINHADFSSTPFSLSSDKCQTVPTGGKGGASNQLEIARQLSFNHRKLWCEQPEVRKNLKNIIFSHYTCMLSLSPLFLSSRLSEVVF